MSQEPIEPQDNGVEETRSTSNGIKEQLSKQSPILLGAVAILVLIICLLTAALVATFFEDGGGVRGGVTPTPFKNAAESIDVLSTPAFIAISEKETITGTVDIPTTLSFLGSAYDVEVDAVNLEGGWEPTVSGENKSVWLFGTIVNYIFGLPNSEANKALLEALKAGDEIEVRTQSGATFTFAFDSRGPAAVDDLEIYEQRQPGITMILLEDGEQERLVVAGRFQVSNSGGDTENVVSLGETAQLGDVQITAVSTSYIADRPEIGPGFAFFMVDYEVRNVGLTAFDSTNLDLTLVDDLGNRYVVNPVASQIGNYPPLAGFLNSNQSVVATAGYQIPINLSGNSLSWVATRTDTGAQVYVLLPFAGRDTAVQGATVTLTRADVSPDLTSLILSGNVTNNGSQPITVTANDVSLTTEEGSVWLLQSTNPSFPWTIAPSQSVTYFLTYQLPPQPTAIFRVLNQEFLLTGLQ